MNNIIEQKNNQVDPRLAQLRVIIGEIIGETDIPIEPATRLDHLEIDSVGRICFALALEEQEGNETFDQAMAAKTVGDLMDLIPKSQITATIPSLDKPIILK